MNITICPLTPDLAEEYARFFDATPHDVNRDEMKCYCITWRNDETYADAAHWFDTREERRSRAIEYVKSGCIRGYLAYSSNEIIGWCNTNEHCRMGKEGFDYVEVYVNADFVNTVEDFRGPIGMYEKCGFVKTGERNGKAVMRKTLK